VCVLAILGTSGSLDEAALKGPYVVDALMEAKSEDDCAVCGELAPELRSLMRERLDGVPLRMPICKACLIAFWENMDARRAKQ
jgi:hypothetical protein